MNKKAVTKDTYEEMLKFLDFASKKYDDKSKSVSDLNKKVEYKKRGSELKYRCTIELAEYFLHKEN